jgi:hypothetical protein
MTFSNSGGINQTPNVVPMSVTDSGYWRIVVDPMNGQPKKDITFFRNAPTLINSLTTTDPFGPATASITVPTVTLLDTPGFGDLYWLVPEANIDIYWMSPQSGTSDPTDSDILYAWEGYFLSFEYGEDGAGSSLTIQCNGAMKQLDDFLAFPEYLSHPLPYEVAIERHFESGKHPSLRLQPIVSFNSNLPSWYSDPINSPEHVFKTSDYTTKTGDIITDNLMTDFLTPVSLKNGDVWSGLLTRSTGNFEKVLSEYIQNLLAAMQTQRGSFSILLKKGRIPYFKHRNRISQPVRASGDLDGNEATLVVDLLWPGVKISVTQDYSQKTNFVYGNGKSLSGNTFNGAQYSADGNSNWFEPFAASDEVYPADRNNQKFSSNILRKEVALTFYDGLDAGDASLVAQRHLEMFADPGITGNLTLDTDPQLLDGTGFARQMVTAGRTVLVKGLFGNKDGIIFHVTSASLDGNNTLSLTIDNKFRDQLTVQEIRKRGRDSLVVSRLMGIGEYRPSVDDLLFPWSYDLGAGYVPLSSKDAIWTASYKEGLISGSFPWTGMTSDSRFSPRSMSSKASIASVSGDKYMTIAGSASTTNSSKNWTQACIPVLLSAQGTISGIKIAAYKDDGTVYQVPFHASMWIEDVKVESMPLIPNATSSTIKQSNKVNMKITSTGTSPITYTIKLVFPKAADITNVVAKRNIVITGGASFITNGVPISVASKSGRTLTCTVLSNALGKIKAIKNTTKNQTVAVSLYAPQSSVLKYLPTYFSYNAGQSYPFYPDAWEKVRQDGVSQNDSAVTGTGTLLAGWGTYYEKAGFYPNSSSDNLPPTGLFVSDAPFSYDFTKGQVGTIDPSVSPTANASQGKLKYGSGVLRRASAFMMIYCDEEWDDVNQQMVARKDSVHFLARLYHQPAVGGQG